MKAVYKVTGETTDSEYIKEMLALSQEQFEKDEAKENDNGDMICSTLEIFDDDGKSIKKLNWNK